jgi:hypothetical protein
MAITELLNEKLLSQAIVKDDKKVLMDLKTILEFSEFTKLLKENVTKEDKERKQ